MGSLPEKPVHFNFDGLSDYEKAEMLEEAVFTAPEMFPDRYYSLMLDVCKTAKKLLEKKGGG